MRVVEIALAFGVGAWLGWMFAQRPLLACARRYCESGAPALVTKASPTTLDVRVVCECVGRKGLN